MRNRSAFVLFVVLLSCACVLAVAPEAQAHGGRLKKKDKKDDKPPPIVPDDRPPVMPGQPGEIPNTPVTPPVVTPDRSSPPPGQGGRGPTTGRRPGGGGEAAWETRWQTWWTLNRWAYFPDRHAGRVIGTVTPNAAESGTLDRRARWEAAQTIAVREHVVPVLLGILDSKTPLHPELHSAALLAFSKVATDDEASEILLRHAEDPRLTGLVTESAALGVGLLRRSDPARQLSAASLDAARERLLALIDSPHAAVRTRSFAALSLGLLGDQPFDTAFTRDGRQTTRGIWRRLQTDHAQPDITAALLDALGMQPPAGIADGVLEGLRHIVFGKRTLKRSFDDIERAHAVTALARIGGSACEAALLRVVTWRRAPRSVKRAASLALGARAGSLDAEARKLAMDAALRAQDDAKDPLSRGLALLAIGRIAGADVRAGGAHMVVRGDVRKALFKGARSGSPDERGFGALALGLSLWNAPRDHKDVNAYINEGQRFLTKTFDKGRGGPNVRSAFAVALGLAGVKDGSPLLGAVVADGNAGPLLRGHAAVSLGMMGRRGAEIVGPIEQALWDKSSEDLRSQAALALSMLAQDNVGALLVKELEAARTERLLAQLALALGQLGDLRAVSNLTAIAKDESRSAISRAMAIASLGLLTDPERRPSLTRLSIEAGYPALTDALHEALTIL